MSGKLTQYGIEHAARVIGCEIAAVKAVIAVEAAGEGFLPDGRPKILFERHIFARLTANKYNSVAPNISSTSPGGYGNASAEYMKLYVALQLDPEAAPQSASWGIGQIMGFNWRMCGEKSLVGFLLAMHNNEDSQLALMAQFIKSAGAADELKRRDWAGFARIYNGPAYAKNKYDTKLAAAYNKALGR